jgi:hypothetical protein
LSCSNVLGLVASPRRRGGELRGELLLGGRDPGVDDLLFSSKGARCFEHRITLRPGQTSTVCRLGPRPRTRGTDGSACTPILLRQAGRSRRAPEAAPVPRPPNARREDQATEVNTLGRAVLPKGRPAPQRARWETELEKKRALLLSDRAGPPSRRRVPTPGQRQAGQSGERPE